MTAYTNNGYYWDWGQRTGNNYTEILNTPIYKKFSDERLRVNNVVVWREGDNICIGIDDIGSNQRDYIKLSKEEFTEIVDSCGEILVD